MIAYIHRLGYSNSGQNYDASCSFSNNYLVVGMVDWIIIYNKYVLNVISVIIMIGTAAIWEQISLMWIKLTRTTCYDKLDYS